MIQKKHRKKSEKEMKKNNLNRVVNKMTWQYVSVVTNDGWK